MVRTDVRRPAGGGDGPSSVLGHPGRAVGTDGRRRDDRQHPTLTELARSAVGNEGRWSVASDSGPAAVGEGTRRRGLTEFDRPEVGGDSRRTVVNELARPAPGDDGRRWVLTDVGRPAVRDGGRRSLLGDVGRPAFPDDGRGSVPREVGRGGAQASTGGQRRPQAVGVGGRASGRRAAEGRRARRRATPGWLQRHPLAVAAVSLVVAVLSLGFAVVQSLRRPEPAPAMVAVPPAAADNTQPRLASTGAGSPSLASVTNNGAATESRREIQRTSRVLEPNYTVQAGDTLNRIAARFDTTVERIQALNDLPDPRALRVGAKLVIPPPL